MFRITLRRVRREHERLNGDPCSPTASIVSSVRKTGVSHITTGVVRLAMVTELKSLAVRHRFMSTSRMVGLQSTIRSSLWLVLIRVNGSRAEVDVSIIKTVVSAITKVYSSAPEFDIKTLLFIMAKTSVYVTQALLTAPMSVGVPCSSPVMLQKGRSRCGFMWFRTWVDSPWLTLLTRLLIKGVSRVNVMAFTKTFMMFEFLKHPLCSIEGVSTVSCLGLTYV